MTIHIEELTFDVIIGLLDFEREKPQRVIINLEASYNYSDNQFIDYADIVLLVKEKLKNERYKLLEDALFGLKEILYTSYPNIEYLYLKIAKPNILPECCVALSHSWDF
jgi:dihydroneopterin aldolase